MLAVEQAVLLEEDKAEARRIGREYIAFYLTLRSYLRAWERAGFGPEDLAAGGSDRLVDAMVAWGSPEAISERLDTGADHVRLHALDADPNALPVGAWRTSPRRCTPGEYASGPAMESGLRSPLTAFGDACVSTNLSTQSRSQTA